MTTLNWEITTEPDDRHRLNGVVEFPSGPRVSATIILPGSDPHARLVCVVSLVSSTSTTVSSLSEATAWCDEFVTLACSRLERVPGGESVFGDSEITPGGAR